MDTSRLVIQKYVSSRQNGLDLYIRLKITMANLVRFATGADNVARKSHASLLIMDLAQNGYVEEIRVKQ